MGNPKNLVNHEHRFTREENARGGKRSGMVRLNTNNINRTIQMYLDKGYLKDNLVKSFEADFLSLSARDRLKFLIAWIPYEKPKLATMNQIIELSGDLTISKEERAARIIELASKIKSK